jgi:hypothetical protein
MRKLFIVFAAVAFAFAFTTPAKAEVNFSGYVAFQTYMTSVDQGAGAAIKDADDLDWTLDRTCSRLTINFKEGPVSAVYEIRPNVGSYVRHWFASWNFGAGTLGIGQFWTPEFSCISSSLYGCGALDVIDPACSVRIPFVQLQFGSLKIAAGQPAAAAAVVGGTYTDTETSMPKLMVSYNLNVAMVGLKIFGGYNTYSERDPATDQTQDIDSYVYGLTASMGFGPLTVAAQLWAGQNTQEYGAGNPSFAAFWDGTKICDESYMAYGVDLAYKVSDMITVTAGYMAGEGESDRPGTYEDPTATYHVNATFTVAKGVTISPEYMVLDNDDVTVAGVKTEQTKQSVMGVYWKIAF